MATTAETRTPVHLWIVGILSLLCGCFGAYDYMMTKTKGAEYIAASMPGIDANAAMAWINSQPIYYQIGWGMGVWLGLLGSVLLLIRNRWAVWSFGLSLLGAVLSLGYAIALAPPMPGADSPVMKAMPYVILAICVALFLYARAMEKRGVLR